ncbi:MAG: InlB B-repeat-containing protein [Lachnospira sp.]
MKSELRKRKKRFWALCLALALTLVNVMPMGVLAAETYDYGDLWNGSNSGYVKAVMPGDVINDINDINGNRYFEIKYYDVDGESIDGSDEVILILLDSFQGDAATDSNGNDIKTHKVRSYSEVGENHQIPEEQFKEWEVIDRRSVYVSGGVEDYLSLKAVKYTKSNIIYYNVEDAINNNPSTYYEGKENINLTDAKKTGYTFGGWYTDEDCTEENKVTSISTDQTGEVKLHAKFTVNDYDITYELNGGTNGNNPTGYTYGTGVSSFADASREGYTFGGWYKDEACTEANKVTSISATQTGDVKLYAKFTVNNYDIEYELNGGTNGNNPTSYTYGIGVASLADASKTGYTFGGWYSDATYTTRVTSISTTQTDIVKLYAKFTVNNYDIEYELNGGTNGNNPTSYTYGIGVASLADASKTGYTFGGWYSDATYTTRVTSISTTQTDIVKLYAKFTVNDYDITYELNGGTNGNNPTGYTYGTGVSSFADASREGYTFGGWYKDEACTEANKVTSISATQTGDVKLYAKFRVNIYNISYELNGGINGNNPTSYTYGTGVARLADASKTGYTFGGWFTNVNFAQDSKVTSISATQTEDVKLYAKFTVNSYGITYELNGGTNGSNPTSYTYGTGVASLADASKTGYTFGGWYTDETCTEANKVTSISATQTGDVKLYAKFSFDWDSIRRKTENAKNGDTITIDMNGETLVPGDVFNDIKGKDITIILDMGDGISWTINGKDITSDNVGDIDFGVEIGTNTIPVDIINKVFGERYTMQLSLVYEGEFGLTAVLSFKLDSKNAGLYANLFYYNVNSGELEFICADEIDADGTVRLAFTHASDYAIVIDRKPLDGSLDTDTEQNTDNSGDDDTQKAPATGDDVWNPLWVIVIGVMIIVFGQGIFFATKKKSSEE